MKPLNYLFSLLVLFSFILASCVEEEPIVSFEMSHKNAGTDEIISFTNNSTFASNYLWDFGDGNTSLAENPKHSYSDVGSYNVTLTATGEGGETSISKAITIKYPEPIASFSVDKTEAEIGTTIKFMNNSKSARSYAWDFGDGNTSTEENPTYSYSSNGTYTVTLTATGEGGENAKSKSINITLPPHNIVPGDRIGEFRLGDDLGTLLNNITETWANHLALIMNNGKWLHLVKYSETGIGFFLETSSSSLSGSNIPNAIYAFEPFEGNTAKKITFGNLLSDVEQKYGSPEKITSTGGYSYISSLGIEFWADDSKTKVQNIYITEPDASKSAKTINLQDLFNCNEFISVKHSKLLK